MNIGPGKVVSFHYKLTDAEGNLLEDSYIREPKAFLCGKNNIMRGLEKAMTDKVAEDKFDVTLDAGEAYGYRKEGNMQRVPIKHVDVKKNSRLKPGQIVSIRTEKGPRQVTVIKSGKFNVDVDGNHPYAGKTLTFAVEVVDVREASTEEKSHGHAHGAGGHHH